MLLNTVTEHKFLNRVTEHKLLNLYLNEHIFTKHAITERTVLMAQVTEYTVTEGTI
jgi:hypothetical protein